MPKIEGFEAGELSLHPSDAGSAAFREAGGVARQFANQSGQQLREGAAAMGAGIKAIGSGIGDMYDAATTHDDTLAATEASRKSADFDFDQHDKLDHIMDPKPDPNDPSGEKMVTPDPHDAKPMIGGFLNDWWEKRQELRASITNDKARKKFDSETESGYRAISNKAHAIYGEVNYNAVKDDILKSTNSRAGVAFSDPTQMDDMLDKTQKDLDTLSSSVAGITADQRSKLATETKTAASRLIIERAMDGLSRTPEGRKKAIDLINSGKYDQYIGEDRGKLLDHMRTMEHADIADASHARTLKEQQAKDQAEARTDQYAKDAASGNPQLKAKDVWTDPAYNDHPELRKQAAGVLKAIRDQAAGDVKVDPAVDHKNTLDLMGRLTLPDGNDNKLKDRSLIDKALIDGDISKESHNFLINQQKQMGTPAEKELAESRKEFFKGYARTIDPQLASGAGPSALGTQNTFKAQQDAIKAENAAKARGEDPRSVYDPASPNFFGKPENLQKYHTPMKDAIDFDTKNQKGLVDVLSKNAPARASMMQPDKAPSGTPMEIAQRYLGQHEVENHATLTAFLNHAGGPYLDPAKTAWCARYVNSVLATAGIQGSNSDAAKSFLHVGQAVNPDQARAGDVIVFNRGNDPSKGHVGFIKSVNGDNVEVISGNHNDRVAVGTYSLSSAVGIRRIGPAEAGGAIPGPLATAGAPKPQQVTRVASPEEAYKLTPGTRIQLPDGRYGTVPYPKVPLSQ